MKHAGELNRIFILAIFAVLFWVLLVGRVTQIQLISRGKYVERANAQYIKELKLNSNRGLIYDRNFNKLAVNQSVYSIGVEVDKVRDIDYAAAQFAELLDGNKTYYLNQLSNGKKFFWLKRGVDEAIVNELQDRRVFGLQIVPEVRRYYPQQRLAAHIIGFTNVDQQGLSGVELRKNEVLSGNAGMLRLQRDALGRPVADRAEAVQEPKSGKNVVLTIDNAIQLSAEEELQRTVDQYSAEGGIVVVTRPMTGEVLAMAVSPTFDPNRPGDYPPEFWRSRAITDNFEPGSTFKPFFMAAVLEEDVMKPDDIIFCENGTYKIYDQTITDVGKYGWLTLRKVLSKSSNIGMSKLAQMMKKEDVYRYARAFGFGVRTGINLSGEVAGEMKNTIEWSKTTPLAMSRGYEVSVTPIQMAMAYGAIANGGTLLRPKIYVDEFNNGENRRTATAAEPIRRVISDSTCKVLVEMLEDVVETGTGKRAAMHNIRVAGKSGTAWKYDVSRQAYSTTEYYSSFVGFFPVEKPELLIYVMVDNPKDVYFGGIVAASTFKRIAERARRTLAIEGNGRRLKARSTPHQQVAPNRNAIVERNHVVPNVVTRRASEAKRLLGEAGIKVDFVNHGQIITKQEPAAGSEFDSEETITLTLADVDKPETGNNYTKVPKVIGLSIRDALNKFAIENLHVLVQGSGTVVRQSPKPGEKIKRGARCVIECESSINLTEYSHW